MSVKLQLQPDIASAHASAELYRYLGSTKLAGSFVSKMFKQLSHSLELSSFLSIMHTSLQGNPPVADLTLADHEYGWPSLHILSALSAGFTILKKQASTRPFRARTVRAAISSGSLNARIQ